MLKLAREDEAFQSELWAMCARDILFYINTFCWTYDPRKTPSAIPFITYKYQDDAIWKIENAINEGHDLFIEKSRDMGASWMSTTVFEHQFHFVPLRSFLLVSRKEDYVDKTEDPKSLMWKIDFVHRNQPKWLLPNINRIKLHIYNEDNASTIDGESTTGDVARGDRRGAILLDEFAAVREEGYRCLKATADATNCRIFNSTPQGTANAFYDMKQTDIEKVRLHWPLHPEKAYGMYYGADGKPRSPWYDGECKRRAHPMEIAQELDIDYLGSDFQFFDPMVLERIERENVQRPFVSGELDYDQDTYEPREFIKRTRGNLSLWIYLDAKGKVPCDREYVVGVDVSAGTGASNSCASVADKSTGEKVAELVDPKMSPQEFARMVVALCKFFKGSIKDEQGAYLIWEANGGPGRQFSDAVVDSGYRNIYYRQNERSLNKKSSDVPGFYSSRESKVSLMGNYRSDLSSGAFITRSRAEIEEAKQYIFTQQGSVEFAPSISNVDPSGARDNHGDRVIATALCNLALHRTDNAYTDDEPIAVPGTLAFRRKERIEAAKSKEWW